MSSPLEFEQVINYTFQDKTILERALTHSSFLPQAPDRALHNNERLEFLGDAFLDAIISAELCRLLPYVPEGVLSKKRAQIVCEKALAEVGENIGIGNYMLMGTGEEVKGGRHRASILADAMEAVIGAIYIDGGYEAAADYVLRTMEPMIELALSGKLFADYKSALQEQVPPGNLYKLHYNLMGTSGPDHDKTFYVELVYDHEVIGAGSGKNKKEAEMQAAKEALERVGEGLVF